MTYVTPLLRVIAHARRQALSLTTVAIMAFPVASPAVPFGGIDFPQGLASFADAIVLFNPGGDVAAPHLDPTLALGAPDGLHVSLGDDGELIVEFLNNALTTSGTPAPDLHVFEIGPVVEEMDIAISTDNVTYVSLGALSGQPTSIDLDAFPGVVPGALYRFVRIRDTDPSTTNSPFGEADIDAVGAITTVLVTVTEPATLALLGLGFIAAGYRRRRR